MARTLLQKLARIARHRWWDEADARRAVPEALLQQLQDQVSASERRHSGEIRVVVEAGLPMGYLWRDLAARDRAVTLFGKLRVWDTAQNNGVLIYLLLAERAIEIVADRGLNQRVSAAQWQAIVQGMAGAFRQGQFDNGLRSAVAAVGGLLQQHFALAEGERNPNELPDRPLTL